MGRSMLVAVSFLTRLPVRPRQPVDGQDVARAAPYFALVGLLLGLWQAGVYWLVGLGIPGLVAAVCSVISVVVVTGAFHYDGLADAADAFVGGWDPQQRREILKDSRLGTYGVMALVLVVALEVSLVSALTPVAAAGGLMTAHAVSRAASVVVASIGTAAGTGIGATISGKVAAYRVGAMVAASTASVVALAVATGHSRMSAWMIAVSCFGMACSVAVVAEGLRRYARNKVGEVTGDTLGAVERCCFSAYLLGWVLFSSV